MSETESVECDALLLVFSVIWVSRREQIRGMSWSSEGIGCKALTPVCLCSSPSALSRYESVQVEKKSRTIFHALIPCVSQILTFPLSFTDLVLGYLQTIFKTAPAVSKK